jgi:8-oxo-dGTP pyrophosphatase MutT (NUDIX family)
MMASWIRPLREKIGSSLIIVNSSGGWIEDERGRVLLQKRSLVRDLWGFPGGVMELGEAAHEAAIREVREETGLAVIPVDMVGIYSKYIVTLENGDNCQTFVTFFRMRITGGALKCDNVETFALEFFEIDAMPALFCDQHMQMAEDAIAGRVGIFR